MDYSQFQRTKHITEHVNYMVKFVYTYCELIQTNKPVFSFAESYHFLPVLFKNVVAGVVNKTLNSSSLLELSSRILQHSDRVDCLVHAFSISYSDEFSDYKFIQWATMLCTLASLLNRQGFELASEIAQNTINILCVRRNRHEAFVSLGCHV